MKSYRRTIFSVLSILLLCVTGYFTFNAYNFESTSVIEQQPKYSQVRIFATSETDIQKMANVDLIIDHANTKIGQFMDAWLSCSSARTGRG